MTLCPLGHLQPRDLQPQLHRGRDQHHLSLSGPERETGTVGASSQGPTGWRAALHCRPCGSWQGTSCPGARKVSLRQRRPPSWAASGRAASSSREGILPLHSALVTHTRNAVFREVQESCEHLSCIGECSEVPCECSEGPGRSSRA